MFRGLIGPYGGTPESESKRPARLTFRSVVTILVMLLILLLAWVVVGNFLGPVIVIVASLLLRRKPALGREFPPAYSFIVNFFYFTGIVFTLYTIFIGGLPIRWQRKGDQLTLSVGFVVEETRIDTQIGNDQLWLMSDKWSLGIPADGAQVLTDGKLVLRKEITGKEFNLPIWADTFRWIIALTILGAEFLCVVLLARQITETLLPSLPDSVVAKPGLLARLFPFLTIKYEKEEEEEPDDDVMPEEAERAPWR